MAVKKQSRIADTTFKTGQDGTLATPDIYAKPPQEPVGASTSVVSTGAGLDISKITGIPGTGPMVGVPKFDPAKITSITGVLGVVTKQLASSENPISLETLKNIQPETIGKLAKAMGYPQVEGLIANSAKIDYTSPQFLDNLAKSNPFAKVLIDGTQTLIKGKDIKNVDDLLKIAGEFTGNTQLASMLNLSGEMAFAKVMIDSANALGLPALGRKILDKYKDNKERRRLELNTANSLAEGTNLTELNTVVDTYGSDAVVFVNENIVTTLLSKYTKPMVNNIDNKQVNDSELLTQLLASLNKLDTNWKFIKMGKNSYYNYEVFSVLSKDAYDLFLTDPELAIPAITANKMQINKFMNPISMLKEQYPYTPIGA